MIQVFANEGTEDIFDGKDTRKARNLLPVELWPNARLKLSWLDVAKDSADLRLPSGNRLEALEGKHGWYSIRINRQYRIVFRWEVGGAFDVEVVDYHQ